MSRFRSALVVVWLLLSLLGAVNQSVIRPLLGQSLPLLLPHLQQGYVMFIEIPRKIEVHSYLDDAGQHSIAEVVHTRAIFYQRARTEANFTLNPLVFEQACRDRYADAQAPTVFVVDEHHPLLHSGKATKTTRYMCDGAGLSQLRGRR
jgi:hypothetical protein